MPKRHYTIFCDESSKKGDLFSNFYGGVMVRSQDRQAIEESLAAKKDELNLLGEIKWTKVTENYKEKYIEFVDHYFSFIRTSRIKTRIMFTQNINRPRNLTAQQIEDQYFILYYQMIKHAFGLAYCNPNALDRVFINVFLDEIPHNAEKLNRFKSFITRIENSSELYGLHVYLPRSGIASVDSKDHNILQGLDIVLGAIHFRLNRMHLAKPEGKRLRGKRTRAKEAVYKAIQRNISAIYPRFNIGTSTGAPNGPADRWAHPYRHWLFRPSDHIVDRRG